MRTSFCYEGKRMVHTIRGWISGCAGKAVSLWDLLQRVPYLSALWWSCLTQRRYVKCPLPSPLSFTLCWLLNYWWLRGVNLQFHDSWKSLCDWLDSQEQKLRQLSTNTTAKMRQDLEELQVPYRRLGLLWNLRFLLSWVEFKQRLFSQSLGV